MDQVGPRSNAVPVELVQEELPAVGSVKCHGENARPDLVSRGRGRSICSRGSRAPPGSALPIRQAKGASFLAVDANRLGFRVHANLQPFAVARRQSNGRFQARGGNGFDLFTAGVGALGA